MRSEFSANLAMQSQPRDDWRAVLAKRETNREVRRARVAQDARMSSSRLALFATGFVGAFVSSVSNFLGA